MRSARALALTYPWRVFAAEDSPCLAQLSRLTMRFRLMKPR
jgi:hypothetical protein